MDPDKQTKINEALNVISISIVILAHPSLTDADRVRTLERMSRQVAKIEEIVKEA